MIFPTEAASEARRDLLNQKEAGRITPEEYFHQLLQADPDDHEALRFLAMEAFESDRFDEARRYARELIRVHPGSYEGYLLLANSMVAGADFILGTGYGEIAMEKLREDEEAMAQVDLHEVEQSLNLCGAASRAALSDSREEELEPHRLIHQLHQSRDSLLDPGVVDAILRRRDQCVPLLLGILKEWGEELLTDDDRPVVERALVLLGEIGNVEALPAFLEFLMPDEDDLSGPADWAFRRTALQHPAESLDRIRRMIPAAGGAERCLLARQLGIMPDTPGRSTLIAGIAEGIGHLRKDHQDSVITSAIASIMLAEGSASLLAASLEKQYTGQLSGTSRSQLRRIRGEGWPPGSGEAEPTGFTVHQICCENPDLEDEEPGEPAPVVKLSKPGRNEPCWCGSGKKYKKCHLLEDERR